MSIQFKKFLSWAVLILLVAILAISLYGMVYNFEFLKLRGEIRLERGIHRRPGPPPSADQIQNWMTFRYINMLFNLPSDYLRTNLNISNNHYPNLTISSWAAQAKVNSTDALAKTIAAVKAYKP